MKANDENGEIGNRKLKKRKITKENPKGKDETGMTTEDIAEMPNKKLQESKNPGDDEENSETNEEPVEKRKKRRGRLKKKNENEEKNDASEKKEKKGRRKEEIVCDVCQKPMRSRYHLKVHSTVHTGEKNFICQICNKGFQQKWNLITHAARVHSKIKPFKCKECGKAYGYSSHFKRHVKTHFLEKIEAPDIVKKRILNPLKCEFCVKSFDSHYRLDLHMKKHTGDKPFVCDKCGKRFTTKRLVAAHMARKHDTEVSDFICEHCGNSFPDRTAMLSHLQTGHKICDVIEESMVQKKGRKPYIKKDKELMPCEVCGKTINRISMNKHLNIHYRNRIYKCKYCEKEFLESSQRLIHERKHTGEKPYLCDVCGKGHSQYGNLLTHRKRYHNLTEKIESLWKRRNAAQTINLNSEAEKINSTPSDENAQNNTEGQPESSEKPPYTGDETIEEFMQKATEWIDEKFKESKPARKKRSATQTAKDESDDDDLKEYKLPEEIRSAQQPDEEECDKNDLNKSEAAKEKRPAEQTEKDDSDEDFFKESKLVKCKKSAMEAEKDESDEDDLPLSRFRSKRTKSKYQEDFEKSIKSQNKYEEDSDESTKDNSDEEYFPKYEVSDSEESIQDNILELEGSNEDNVPNEEDENIEVSEIKIETEELECKANESITDMDDPDSKASKLEAKTTEEANSAKFVMKKIHYLIYDKIIEDLEATVEDDKLKEIVKVKILISEGKKEKDPLQQILKLLKPIPDNCVTKSIEGKLFWHCWQCDSKFHNRHLLTRHLLIHEPEENRPYKCELCFKTFTQSNNYKEHVMSHKNENQYYCEKCGTGFRHKTHFNKHLRKHDPNMIDPRPKNFKCSYCEKKFATNFHKTEHERKHTNERPYLCKSCGAQFGTLSTLNKHMQTHAAAKHQCNICLRFFRHKFSLKRHHRTHSYDPDQRVRCECGQSFSQRPSLKRHKLICIYNEEPAEKAFECLICSKKFGGSHDLKRHIATHETSKKYKCAICSTRCKTRETYKRHLKRHRDKPNDTEETFSCDECDYTSEDIKDITKHIVQTHLNWR